MQRMTAEDKRLMELFVRDLFTRTEDFNDLTKKKVRLKYMEYMKRKELKPDEKEVLHDIIYKLLNEFHVGYERHPAANKESDKQKQITFEKTGVEECYDKKNSGVCSRLAESDKVDQDQRFVSKEMKVGEKVEDESFVEKQIKGRKGNMQSRKYLNLCEVLDSVVQSNNDSASVCNRKTKSWENTDSGSDENGNSESCEEGIHCISIHSKLDANTEKARSYKCSDSESDSIVHLSKNRAKKSLIVDSDMDTAEKESVSDNQEEELIDRNCPVPGDTKSKQASGSVLIPYNTATSESSSSLEEKYKKMINCAVDLAKGMTRKKKISKQNKTMKVVNDGSDSEIDEPLANFVNHLNSQAIYSTSSSSNSKVLLKVKSRMLSSQKRVKVDQDSDDSSNSDVANFQSRKPLNRKAKLDTDSSDDGVLSSLKETPLKGNQNRDNAISNSARETRSSDSDSQVLSSLKKARRVSPRQAKKKQTKESGVDSTSEDLSDSEFLANLKTSKQIKRKRSSKKKDSRDGSRVSKVASSVKKQSRAAKQVEAKRKRNAKNNEVESSSEDLSDSEFLTNLKTSKKSKLQKKSPNTDTESRSLKMLKKVVRAAGLFLNYKKEFKDCKDDCQRVSKLKAILAAAGMKGRPTMKAAKIFRLQREAQELDKKNIIAVDSGRPKRNVRSFFASHQLPPDEKLPLSPKDRFRRLKGIVDSEGSSSSDME